MKNISLFRTAIIVCFSLFISLGINAQKYAHINSNTLMMDLPAIKDADKEIQALEASMTKEGEDMLATFQANYQDYVAKVNSGTLSQVQAAEIEANLTAEQTKIQGFQQDMQTKILTKRQELYDPIFQKVRDVIAEYGKANGYTMIFDSSLGAILFESSEDITDIIKAKL